MVRVRPSVDLIEDEEGKTKGYRRVFQVHVGFFPGVWAEEQFDTEEEALQRAEDVVNFQEIAKESKRNVIQ